MDELTLHTLHFNVTNTCNLACKFCYADSVRAKTTTIPLDRIQGLADEAASVGCKRVILSGGEIFARDDWYDICLAFSRNGILISLVSNGTLVGDTHVRLIKTIPGFSILISLDGDEPNHDEIRGMRGSHRKTMRAIDELKVAGVDFQINATIIKKNLGDVIFLANLSSSLDVDVRLSLLNKYNGRGGVVAPEALDVADIVQLREYVHSLRMRGSKVFLNIPPLLQYPEDVIPIRSPSCGWTKSYCGVTNDGDVTICGVAGADTSLHQGNIREQSFARIWVESPLFNTLRSLHVDDLQGVCGRCRVRHACGGACRLSAYKGAGDFKAPYSLCEAFYENGLIPENALEPVLQ